MAGGHRAFDYGSRSGRDRRVAQFVPLSVPDRCSTVSLTVLPDSSSSRGQTARATSVAASHAARLTTSDPQVQTARTRLAGSRPFRPVVRFSLQEKIAIDGPT